jgi:hypothetical protein
MGHTRNEPDFVPGTCDATRLVMRPGFVGSTVVLTRINAPLANWPPLQDRTAEPVRATPPQAVLTR